MPAMPSILPVLEVSGDDRPLNAVINKTPDITYAIATKLTNIY
jgi:hypothetical protein